MSDPSELRKMTRQGKSPSQAAAALHGLPVRLTALLFLPSLPHDFLQFHQLREGEEAAVNRIKASVLQRRTAAFLARNRITRTLRMQCLRRWHVRRGQETLAEYGYGVSSRCRVSHPISNGLCADGPTEGTEGRLSANQQVVCTHACLRRRCVAHGLTRSTRGGWLAE